MVVQAFRSFFGLDEDFVRPLPERYWKTDIWIAVVLTAVTLTTLVALSQSTSGDYRAYLFPTGSIWPAVAVTCLAGVLTALRRRWPLTILVALVGFHFILVGIYLPAATITAGMQATYFVVLVTAIGYARRRDALAICIVVLLLAMTIWLVVADSYTRSVVGKDKFTLWMSANNLLVNIVYFGAALWLGYQSWAQAKAMADLAESNELVQAQTAQLAQQAVFKERLRIARDLHDSVAHFISMIGIQTAAARRVLAVNPEAATEALKAVESLSRDAVGEMKTILGTLRDDQNQLPPQNLLAALETLCQEANTPMLQITLDVVGDTELAQKITTTQASAIRRIVQEALTNIRRHSTAKKARVVLRLGNGIELEITNDGRSKVNSSGSGMGQVGMRERVLSLGGSLEVGPRATGGYRVLAQIPGVR